MDMEYHEVFSSPQPDLQTQSYVLDHLAELLGQPVIENLTDLYAVSVPSHCLCCPFRKKNKPSCNQCNQCSRFLK